MQQRARLCSGSVLTGIEPSAETNRLLVSPASSVVMVSSLLASLLPMRFLANMRML